LEVGEEGSMQDTTDKSCGVADEGGGADEALNVMSESSRDEGGRGAERVKTSAVDGAGNAVCKRSVFFAIDAKTVGGEARSSAKIASPWGVYVYVAYNGALESMGKKGYFQEGLGSGAGAQGLLPEMLLIWGGEGCGVSDPRAVDGRVFHFALNGVGETLK